MTLIVLAVFIVLVLVIIAIYNRLVALRQNCRQGLADIDAQLRQRHDLIPNLVSTVQGYAAHEKATLDSVIAARNAAAANPGAQSESELKFSLDRLLALGEAYPDLKANANFQALQGELAALEDKLAAARRAFNAAVSRFNTARDSFPAVLFASLFGFGNEEFHRIADSEKGVVDQVPKVTF